MFYATAITNHLPKNVVYILFIIKELKRFHNSNQYKITTHKKFRLLNVSHKHDIRTI